jgi:hypothetical protein
MTKNPSNKFGAKKTRLDGYIFDSAMEAKRYGQLKLLLRAGEISELRIHPSWPIRVNDKPICHVELDFEYRDRLGRIHHEDVKGAMTALSSVKRKLVEASHGIEVELLRKV